MRGKLLLAVTTLAVLAGSGNAQTLQRRATYTLRESPDRGKCTIEVVVDIAVEIDIRGENATMRNFGGQAPQWRRFECTGPMPANPRDFRFAGVDGRGRQQLIGDPRNGGAAVVRIEDKDGGSEGYTFDLFWNNGGGDRRDDRDNGRPLERDRGVGRRFSVEQAVRVCQDAVAQQANDRFRTRNVNFGRTTLDDNPGRNDWVIGTFDVRRGFDRQETYRFSCSVDFDSGRVRSAQIDEPVGGGGAGRAIDSCRRAVEERIRRDGYDRIEFESINVDNRPGRNDWIVGVVRADSRNVRREPFNFSCSVNLRDGDIRSVDVSRR